MSIIFVLFGASIYFIDYRKSQPVLYDRDISGNVEKAKDERECVQVRLSQLNEFLSVLSQRTSEFANVKKALYDAEQKKTIINVQGSESVIPILLGSDKVIKRWEKYYKEGGNVIFFDTDIKDDDTIVQCPAFVFAKLVEAYEITLK